MHGCRYKLSLLHNPGHQGAPPAVSFKDFATDKASNKAKKAAASNKGFGATAASKQAGTAAAGAAELTAEQLEGVLRCNAYGDDHLDGGLTTCRKEQQSSIIGACKAAGWEQLQLADGYCVVCIMCSFSNSNAAALPSQLGHKLSYSSHIYDEQFERQCCGDQTIASSTCPY